MVYYLKTIGILFGCMSILLLSGGCALFSSESYHPVKVFDLGEPEPVNLGNTSLTINQFNCDGPFRTKMVYRTAKCTVFVDQYNKWLQPPYLLVSNYLKKRFIHNSRSYGADFIVNGNLVTYDIDVDKKRIMLAIDYSIRAQKDDTVFENSFCTTEPFSKNNPAVFAQAMSKAMAKFADDLEADIMNIYRKMAEKIKKEKELMESVNNSDKTSAPKNTKEQKSSNRNLPNK